MENYQNIGVLEDGLVRRRILANLEDAAPLGKLASVLLVLRTTAVQIIKTLSRALVLRAKQVDNTLVNLDTRVDSTALENVNESNSSASLFNDTIQYGLIIVIEELKLLHAIFVPSGRESRGRG